MVSDLDCFATIIYEKLYNKTIVDYWDIGYEFDIHHRLQVLTSAIASLNISICYMNGLRERELCLSLKMKYNTF